MTEDTQVTGDYLAELDSLAAARLTTARRHELVADIREHISTAVAAGEAVLAVVTRLGTPAEIISAESPEARLAPEPPRLRATEYGAVVLLLFGAFLVLVGWLAGVVLLWTSDRWTTRDKWIGTLLWPGGLVVPSIWAEMPGGSTSISGSCDINGVCTSSSSTGGLPIWLGITIGIVLILVPIGTTIYLVRRARVPR